MKLLIVRHAIAEEREEWAQSERPDSERPLTRKGRKRMRRAARGLRRLVRRIDLLATSPYTRAVQTAEILAAEYGGSATSQTQELVPERASADFLEWLKRLDDIDTIAAVGHEPHLSGLATWLISGQERNALELKKGGALLLEFNGTIEAGAARLLWSAPPRILRGLA